MRSLVNRYLTQLGVNLSLTGLALVEDIKQRHIAQLSFNSGNVILKRDLSLAPYALFQRVVFDRQGGYCFEHNKILYLVLQTLGFNVSPLIGRVLINGNEENGRLHRITLLQFENKHYLVDVGFGVANPRFVVPLEPFKTQTKQGYYVLKNDGEDHFRLMYSKNEQDWLTLYRFDLSEATESDCDIAHFYSSQHPEAMFVNSLVVSRIESNRRYLLKNRELTVYKDNKGESELINRFINSSEELVELLTNTLNLNVSLLDANKLYAFLCRN